MLIQELVDNPIKLKEHRKKLDELKNNYPDRNWSNMIVESINDTFVQYSKFLKELQEKYSHFNLVEDCTDTLTGLYVCSLGEKNMIELYSDYDILDDHDNWDNYGVCDNGEQVLNYYRTHLQDGVFSKDKEYIITLTPIVKHNQPSTGGWRWHKWGPYIGVQDSCHEYLYDEENIDMIYVFEINEIKKKAV